MTDIQADRDAWRWRALKLMEAQHKTIEKNKTQNQSARNAHRKAEEVPRHRADVANRISWLDLG